MVCAQNAASRDVSDRPGSPMLALNHCRFVSIRLSREMGGLAANAAARAKALNCASGALSRTSSARSEARRDCSLSGFGAITAALRDFLPRQRFSTAVGATTLDYVTLAVICRCRPARVLSD